MVDKRALTKGETRDIGNASRCFLLIGVLFAEMVSGEVLGLVLVP